MNHVNLNKIRYLTRDAIALMLTVLLSANALADSSPEMSPVDGETEMASLSRDSDLMEKPETGAKVVTKLKAKTEVQVINRSGAWAEISTKDSQQGYVRLLNLRTTGQARGKTGINTLVKSFKTGSSGQSVATGVKGMSSEELKSSEVDDEQVKQLASLQANVKEAKKEAKTNGLKTQKVPELDKKEK